MVKEKFDILTDYEELCGRLKDILIVLGMTSVGEDSEKTATVNVVSQALESLIVEHTKNTHKYRGIKTWEAKPKHAHSTMNNLLLKAVTDMNAKQLVKSRGGYNGIDSLTSDELEQYQAFEDMVIAMIGLNMSYQEIKAMAFRNKKTRQRSV
ncbi:phage protein [Streptococcus pneumoniae]|nr:phage protein [Streptococcus pneumoniae]